MYFQLLFQQIQNDTILEILIFIPCLKKRHPSQFGLLSDLGDNHIVLTVIFGVKNVGTMYVRCHRIRKKLKAECSIENLIVMTIFLGIILWV
jgi:hypothetical protein